MRTKLTLSLLITIMGFVVFLEILEYNYRNTKSLYETRVLDLKFIDSKIKNNLPEDRNYTLLKNELDLKFTKSENKEEWFRELYYIEKKGTRKNMIDQTKLSSHINYKTLDTYKTNYTGNMSDNSTKKILLLGDSFVGGFAQERYNLNYHIILKDMMSKNENLNKYEIFSIAKTGSFYSYLMALDSYYDIIRPDIVIVGFLSNDFQPDVERTESSSYIDCIYGHNYLIDKIDLIPNRYKISKENIKEYFCKKKLTDEIKSKEDIGVTEKLFEKGLNKLKDKYGVENVIIANTEPPIDLYYSYPFEQFRKKNFNLVKMKETYELLANTNKIELYINPFDWHPGPELSYTYALDIYNYLLENHQHNKNQNTIKKNNSIIDITNAVLNKDDNGEIFTIEKIIDVSNYDTLNPESLSIIGGRTDLYNKAQYPLQLSYCAKLNRPYDVYEFEKSSKFTLTLEKSENDSLFIINYYFENGKIIEKINLLKNGYSLEVNEESLGFMVATPYSGCALDKTIDTGLYKIKIDLN